MRLACALLMPPLLNLLFHASSVWAFSSLPALFPLWWLGALAAEMRFGRRLEVWRNWYEAISRRPFWLKRLSVVMVGSAVLIYCAAYGRHTFMGGALRYGYQALFALFIAAVLLEEGSWKSTASRWLAWLGERSYTLYAMHLPLIALVSLMHEPTSIRGVWFLLLVALSVVALCTILLFRLVEGPSHAPSRRI